MARFIPVLIAAIAAFAFGAAYYMALGKTWMEACGKTEADMLGPDGKPKVPVGPMIVSFISELVMAVVLGIVLSRLGANAVTGMLYAALIWLGIVMTTMATNNAYGGAKLSLTLIDGGHWLGVLLIQGLLLGFML